MRKASKIVHEWNSNLEIFSRPQVIDSSMQYLLLRTDVLQKKTVRCRWNLLFCHSVMGELAHNFRHAILQNARVDIWNFLDIAS